MYHTCSNANKIKYDITPLGCITKYFFNKNVNFVFFFREYERASVLRLLRTLVNIIHSVYNVHMFSLIRLILDFPPDIETAVDVRGIF